MQFTIVISDQEPHNTLDTFFNRFCQRVDGFKLTSKKLKQKSFNLFVYFVHGVY